MGTIATTQPILEQAKRCETEYNWAESAELYEKALGALAGDESFQVGALSERAGYAYYKSALQGKTRDDFALKIRSAISAYEKAGDFYTRAGSHRSKVLRSHAMVSFLKLWPTPKPSERRHLIEEAWVLANEALQAFDEAGDAAEYLFTYNQLSQIPAFAWLYESDPKILERTLREAVAHGERALQRASVVNDPSEAARSHVSTASFIVSTAAYVQDIEEGERREQLAEKYWSRAKELDKEAATLELSLCSYEFLGTEGSDENLGNWKRALEIGRNTGDRLTIGTALCSLSFSTAWKAVGTEDPDERTRLMQEALKLAEDGKHQFESIPMACPFTAVMWPQAPLPEYYFMLGTWEPDIAKRRTLCEMALKESPEMLRQAEDAGYPQCVLNAHHVFSKVLTSVARMEGEPRKKEELLKRALEHRNLTIDLSDQIEPFVYLNKAVYQHYLAEIMSELSDLAQDIESKNRFLRQAIQHKGSGIDFARKVLPSFDRRRSMPQIGYFAEREYEYGNMLIRLHKLAADKTLIQRALEVFDEASGLFEKANLPSRRAECYWRAAQSYDNIGDFLNSAESFLSASESFKAAADKLPKLAGFYRHYALYMEAWSEIEKARNHHDRQENGRAKESYEKAANLHKSSERWDFLSPNYSAWAKIEEAEDLSRKEHCSEAIQAYEEAARLFIKAQGLLRNKLTNADDLQQNQTFSGLAEAATIRHAYCKASITLEEARILEKKGDHHSSMEKFGKVAESLERLIPSLNTEQDRREIKRCMTLAKAWQMMMSAELEASPRLYLEAAQLFEQAKDLSQTEKGRLLALGHSRFCKALESGARFSDTRDVSLHEPTMHSLESASNYYLKAGFKNASKYAEACKLLFDAYVAVDNANKETDHDKKARQYMIAEKVLEASAAHFAAAEYPAKKEEVLQLLERVRNERELAVSLTTVLHGPSSLSFVSGITTPTKTQESPVGLEMFDHAHIQSNLMIRQRNLRVGENCEVEIELVNAGKGPAQLVKLEELLPEGFELTQNPEGYRLEDSYLNMRGKRLDPLKTVEVRLTLKPRSQGQFTVKPRILYLDEGGKYKSHEPDPITLTVKELGITGWLKGH
jgi:hypothetical protein